MSSAANHRKRSRRGYIRIASAMRGEKRNMIRQQADRRTGADGAPLIFRLQAFHRRIQEHRRAKEGAED